MTVDHILFNNHKYILDVQVINDLVDPKLIGKTITRSNYTVYWAKVLGDDGEIFDSDFNDNKLSTKVPDGVDASSIATTGIIKLLRVSPQNTPYFVVDFHDNTVDGYPDQLSSYYSYVKASDVMQRYVSGERL